MLQKLNPLRRWIIFCFALLFALSAASPAFARSGYANYRNAVYVLTNNPDGNQVMAYHRDHQGNLTWMDTLDTGGTGSGVGVTVPPDPLGSQNALLLSKSGKWLFAVNAGSDEITLFKATPEGLKWMDKVSSGGDYPVSLAFDETYLYVLNAGGDGNITGFELDDGKLMPLADSTRSLSATTPADGEQPNIMESPSQVGFAPDGRHLLVLDKGGVSGEGRILIYNFADGLPASDPQTVTTAAPVPFAFAFDRFGQLVVVEASTGSIITYRFNDDGGLDLMDTVTNGQMATCWIDGNGKYFFTDNTGSNTISAIRPSSTGRINLLNPTEVTYPENTLPLDLGVDGSGEFLYTLNVGAGSIGIFHIDADGHLHDLGQVEGLPSLAGFQGIAVH